MRFIAHRGNIEGRNPDRENTISYIEEALALDLDVEIDVTLSEGQYYLGHDELGEVIPTESLNNHRIWCHAKTLETLRSLAPLPQVNVFFQTTEQIVLTSKGFFWNHSDVMSGFGPKDVGVMLDYHEQFMTANPGLHALCSDHALTYKEAAAEVNCLQQVCPFDLLILDIDGVMTDGTKTYGVTGECISKKYADIDFTGIKRFRSSGVSVCFLSGDNTVNENMAKIREVPFYYSKGIPKSQFLDTICKDFGVEKSRVAYVGDDFYDMDIMQCLDHIYCPSDSAYCIKQISQVLEAKSGKGVVEELYSKLFEGRE